MGVRRWTAVGATGGILAATAGCSLWGGGQQPSACTTPPAAVATQPSSDTSALRVAESGFTQLGPNRMVVSIGAVLENAGDQVAYRTLVKFELTGPTSVSPGSDLFLVQEIPVILPKQKLPIGAWAYTDAEVTAIKVKVGPVTWLPRDGRFAEVTTAFESLTRTESNPDSASVSYKVTSGYCRPLTMRGVAVVFRDAGGKIVGGSLELSGEFCPPGVSAQRMSALRSTPAGIEESKTQATAYCDFTGPSLPKPHGGPAN